MATTLKLTNVVLEITNVNIGQNPVPNSTEGKMLNVNANINAGGKLLSTIYKNYPLSAEDLKTPIDGLETLALAKISAELGLV